MIKIKIYGLGGQGVVTMGKVLCIAYSIYENDFAKTMPAYGHERKGGAVLTDVIADKERILTNSFITDPDCIIVLDSNVSAEEVKLDVEKHKNAVLILNTDTVKQDYAAAFSQCWYTDATKYSLEQVGKNLPNVGMMGALAKVGLIGLEAIESAVRDYFGKSAESYLRIIKEGYDGTQKR